MKGISSLRNGNPAAPPPPVVLSADERCSSAHLGKIPLHSNLAEMAYLAFLYFMYLF